MIRRLTILNNEQGFTLIELLVVVIIIGLLSAIAIPVFLDQRNDALSHAARANVRTAGTAEQSAYTATGVYVALADLGPHGFNEAGAEPAVSGGVGATEDIYCLEATGGGDRWVMDQDMGAPQIVAAGC